MRINTNVSSLVAQESATNTGKAIASSLEKLSSGLRINKASDDSSGLAIADKLRTQATSIGQGISNGNSAVALLQIADKSMGEQSNILDTIKSKLVQANTDTTSDAGRESIRKDVSKLLTQLDNIAAQTNYNGKSLLADVKDGKLTGKEASALNFQIGANNTNIISTASINSTTASLGGGSNTKISEIKENSTTTLKNVTGGTLSLEAATGANLDINVSGNLGKVSGDGSDINFIVDPKDTELISKLKGLEKTSEFVQDGTYDNVFKLTSGKTVDLSTVNFSNVQITGATANKGFNATGSTFTVTNNDLSKSIAVKLEQKIGEGQTTTVSSSATSKDGATTNDFTLATSGSTALNAVISGNLGSTKIGSNAVVIETTNSSDTNALQKLIDDGNSDISRTGDKFTFTASKVFDLSAITLTDAKITAATGSTSVLTSTSSKDITITNNDKGNLTLSNIDALSGDNLSSLKNLEENGLSQATASRFQSVVDDAITQLNGYRGDIGSTQNQVESAVRNLSTQQTNIKAAESIIRDVDYAQESANFNKQNIISQAGSYAMSQANAVQQNVLRLLQ
jgi:flagellin